MTSKKPAAAAAAAATPKPKAKPKPEPARYEYTGKDRLEAVIPDTGEAVDVHPGDVIPEAVYHSLGEGFFLRDDFKTTSKPVKMKEGDNG